jgi:hypothetical protein
MIAMLMGGQCGDVLASGPILSIFDAISLRAIL